MLAPHWSHIGVQGEQRRKKTEGKGNEEESKAQHTDAIRPSVRKHSLHITRKLGDASIRLRRLSEPDSVTPPTDSNHDLGIGELSADSGDRSLGLESGSCVGGGEGEDYMVDTPSVCCILRAGGMPSEEFMSIVKKRLGRKEHSLICVHNEASVCRSCKQRRKEGQ